MKIIKCLTSYIDEEIGDSKKYIEKAIEVKEEYPEVAELFNKLSLEELKHMQALHTQVVQLINQYRAEHGDPPEGMMAVYNYLHEKAIEKTREVKVLQQMFLE